MAEDRPDAPARFGSAAESAAALDAWTRLGLLLLEASCQHAVRFSPADWEKLRQRIQQAQNGLREDPPPSEVLIAAGSLAQAVEHYNHHTQSLFEARLRDLRGLVQTLLQHVEGVQAHLPSAAQLARIRTEWDAAPLDQLTLWQERVTACLQSLTLEQAESGKHAVTPQASAGTAPVSPAMDAVTGLPTRKIAESAIQTALSGSKPVYVALFYVHRMGLTNARFGEAIGNQVMQFCGQHIATHLIRSNDLLSRWRGASLLAVLERDGTEQAVTAEVQRIVSAPLSRFFETTSRTVYLPMKMSAEVIATTGKTWTEIEERIETFILHAAHATE